MGDANGRKRVRKTYKLFVKGAFVRSEQGRVLAQMNHKGEFFGNVARANRKDLRDAILAARSAQSGWSGRSAFNRGQIVYRIAEMLEDRRELFESRLVELLGYSEKKAVREVDAAVDRIMYYGGWADKYAQVVSSVNPVASPFFNFSVPEPTGVVVLLAPRRSPFLGLITALIPVLVPGNTCVSVVDASASAVSLDLAEVLATSDVPPGVVNVLTGERTELVAPSASHKDVNALVSYGSDGDEAAEIDRLGAESVMRIERYAEPDPGEWAERRFDSLYRILPFVEIKTAWHPVGV